MKVIFGFLIVIFVSIASMATPPINCNVTYHADVTATTVSTAVRPKLSGRKCLVIQNKGGNTIYVKVGSSQTGTEGIQISGNGGSWEPFVVPANSIYIETGSSTSLINIEEGQ